MKQENKFDWHFKKQVSMALEKNESDTFAKTKEFNIIIITETFL